MWIPKVLWERLNKNTDDGWKAAAEAGTRAAGYERENARIRADLDWFKLRLNAVEKERAQLIAAAIGVKISVPEFMPKFDNVEEAFNQLPDLSSVGGDAKDEQVVTGFEQETGIDYSQLPGYRGAK
jgi:hypothetical protein